LATPPSNEIADRLRDPAAAIKEEWFYEKWPLRDSLHALVSQQLHKV